MKARIAIIEDDAEICRILSGFLTRNGYAVSTAAEGRTASALLQQETFDLILMDLMLPHKSGEVLIAELRQHTQTPVIVISAKSMMETKLDVLRLGADDYIIKPFDLSEVLVRIEVILRRTGSSAKNDVLVSGSLTFYGAENRVEYGGQPVQLTAKELEILHLLMKHPKKVFTKAELYESVWNEPYYYEDNTINVHMSKLRSKLKKASGTDWIETVWGIGYRLQEA
ncbi:MAG: response regulator transcription factor [Oscillospiraceae bacterium]|nr:response regulator transcription factor [Oscillospiraceae bacterium]